MICHKNKLIYIHLPKCGGTSIEVAFTGRPWHQRELRREQHLTAAETLAVYGEEVFDTYFKFTIVRNTWDLLVAYYLWGCWGLRGRLGSYLSWGRQWGHPFDRKKTGIHKLPSLKSYIRDLESFNRRLGFSSSGADLTRQLASISIDGCIAVDHVGHFENMQTEIDRICRRTDIAPRRLPHLLKSSRKRHYSGFYNRTTREMVREKYREDIEAFGFTFERRSKKWW